ncbi:penicillin-binding protein 2 [Actinomarinicola tropica]|uniref:Penicillin-binding protein 2 n=1 Tax=Actinomarinicola tropica TaxID=2789776 RepID=A0A5Q2RMR8_9ACTN|nr:penicillin-binding protein 2 [Actinomarinicola tropica]QGG95706.1 penicillin-binding protein 2 [Actinomarinicola tropica]
MHDSQPLRLSILGIVAVALFTALFSRLWFLQVMAVEEYEAVGVSNRTRTIVVEGPRGRILDRNGVVLADNREAVVVTVDRSTLEAADDPQVVLTDLVAELNRAGVPTTIDEVEAAIDGWTGDPYRPIVVANDVGDDLYITLSERATSLPGVGVEKRLVRQYPNGSLAAHVLGYTGEINADELAARVDAEKAYQLGDRIGKMGIEQQYEGRLRGVPGSITFEVDSMGRIVSILDRVEPQPGDDVWLTLDADVQRVAEESLASEIVRAQQAGGTSNDFPIRAPAGSAVVTQPDTGEVVAMASYPTFDPNELIGGVSSARYQELTAMEPHFSPMTNRAIRGQYAPGSTFKIFTGYAAATMGVRAPGVHIDDTGSYTINNCVGRCTFENSSPGSNGPVNLQRALTISSNVYFFQLGAQFHAQPSAYGPRPIQDVAAQFGLGQRTGLALPNEAGGLLIDAEVRAQRHEDNPEAYPEGNWYVGDSVNLAIGQGEIAVTPLQLVNAYATMGNGGQLHNPNIVRQVTDPLSGEVLQSFEPRLIRDLELDGSVRAPILDGLVGVTQSEEGTASRVFAGYPHAEYPVAGKTGTAQNYGRASNSLFAGWAPAHDPEYAIAVVVEEGGYGSRVAAPIARRILEPIALREIDGTPISDVPEIEVEAGGSFD